MRRMTRLRRALHVHRDRAWRRIGAHGYYQCRCGARRVRHLIVNMNSPVRAGWPPLVDRHDMPLRDTGWVVLDSEGEVCDG